MIDTRQTLGKRPPHTDQDRKKSSTRPLPTEGKRSKRQTYEGAYTSAIPQVNYTEGTAPNNLPSSVRTLLQAPSRSAPDHSEPPPCPTATGPHSPKKSKTEAPKPRDNTPQTYTSRSPPAYNGAPHTRKRPPEDNPQNTSKKQKTADTPGNG
jgi:hypothetical protein